MNKSNNLFEALSLMQEVLDATKTNVCILENANDDFLEGYILALKSIVSGMRLELRAIQITRNGEDEAQFLEKRIDMYSGAAKDIEGALIEKRFAARMTKN